MLYQGLLEMKIGYPCINRTIECQGNRTFRLKSYSEKKLVRTIDNNLDCLLKILQFNVKHNILFFRITSDLVPFASHSICKFNWQKNFRKKFQVIGDYIKYNNIRESADFNVISNLNIIKNNFDHNSNIITEGIFKSSAFRYKLIDKFKSTHDVICIYINESLENLSTKC